MPIYQKGYILYDFNRQRAFEIRYIAGNPLASREYQKHDDSNIEHKNNVFGKG